MKYALGILACLLTFSSYANIVVVVNKSSEIKSLSAHEVANIFLARTTRFPNGDKSIPVELKTADIREVFYESISSKTPKQLMAYWTTLVFTGKGRPPKRYVDINELQTYIENNLGAITYLEQDLVTDNMKVVYRFP